MSRLTFVDGWRGAGSRCGLGPDERLAALVVSVDEGADGGDEFLEAVEEAASDRLASDGPEADFDEFSHDPDVVTVPEPIKLGVRDRLRAIDRLMATLQGRAQTAAIPLEGS